MPLLMAEGLIGICSTYRVVHIAGRYGGGKTSLAFRLAYELLSSGQSRYLYTNIPCVWADNPNLSVMRADLAGVERWLDAVVVLDEGGLFLRNNSKAEQFTAFLRKLNITIIVCSIMPPARMMRSVQVQRTLDFMKFGIPLWSYEWRINDNTTKDKDTFYWLDPAEIFGVYDNLSAPVDDGGIGDLFEDLAESLANRSKMVQYTKGARKWFGYQPTRTVY